MFGGFGSTWGDNFYMGTQNGSKLEVWPWGILIHTLELKLRPFEVAPYVCIGSHAFAMFSAHALREGRGHALRAHINVTTITHFDQNWCIGCLLALYGSTMHPAQLCGGFRTTMWWFLDNFFTVILWISIILLYCSVWILYTCMFLIMWLLSVHGSSLDDFQQALTVPQAQLEWVEII